MIISGSNTGTISNTVDNTRRYNAEIYDNSYLLVTAILLELETNIIPNTAVSVLPNL